MPLLPPTNPSHFPSHFGAFALVLLGALAATSACVDLQEPWNKATATGGATGVPATGGAAGGTAGIGADGSAGATAVGQGGTGGALAQGGAGGAIDGAGADGPADLSLTGSGGVAGAGQDGPLGSGGTAQGGAGGSPDVPLGGVGGGPAGGAGGTVPFDLAGADTIDTPPDAPADMPGDASDIGADVISNVGLVAYYPCEGPGGASGTVLPDVSGNDNHGTLAIGPAPATGGASGTGGSGGTLGTGGTNGAQAFSFATGKVGNGLALNGSAYGHVTLPSGLLAGQQAMTIAAFIRVSGTAAYQRVFDFGTDTTNFMYLATANSQNTGPRFRIVSANSGSVDGGGSQSFEGTQPIATGTWTHLALVLGPGGVAIYVNGALQASSPDITLRPADLGSTTSNFIGRSEFPKDPYFDGAIDEYRIYSRALSAAEIATLAGG